MTTASLIRVANLDELHGEGPHALLADGFDVVVVRTPAGVRAFEGRCPHQGALLGEGELDGDKLVCRNHRWRFSVDSGQREGGPQCLASCPVVERERAIFVDVSGLSCGPGRNVAKRTLDDLPGPRGLPFLGNIHQLDLTKLHLILERWAAEYGPVYLFRKGSARAVVLSDPKWCDQVLQARPETFTRDSGIAPVASEMGFEGVFSAEGDAWRQQRRLAMSALAQRHLRGLYPKLQTVATRLKKRWERLADAGAPVDVVDELKRFTVDVTTLVTFGHDVNTVERGDDVIQRKLAGDRSRPASRGSSLCQGPAARLWIQRECTSYYILHAIVAQRCQKGRRFPVTEGRVSDQPFATSQRPYRGVRRDNAILRLRQFAYPRAVPVNADRLAQTRSIDCTRKW